MLSWCLKVIDHIAFFCLPLIAVCVQSIYSGLDVFLSFLFVGVCLVLVFCVFLEDGPFQRSLKAKSCYCFLLFQTKYFPFFFLFSSFSFVIWPFVFLSAFFFRESVCVSPTISFATFIYKCNTRDLVIFSTPLNLFYFFFHVGSCINSSSKSFFLKGKCPIRKTIWKKNK